jgi:hypothetical protein
MADLEVNLYLTMKEYDNNGYHSARLVRDALEESSNYRNLTHDVSIIDELHDVGGQDGDCGGGPWDEWSSRVSNGNIKDKARSNLLITARGYWDDANGDGCAYVNGQAAMTEGGKAFDNVGGISDVPRYDTKGNNKTHMYLGVAQMEVGHNYGGRHGTDNDPDKHHGNDTYHDGDFWWTPIVQGYGDLEGATNVCGTDTLDTYNNQNDRYYGGCMADEIQN